MADWASEQGHYYDAKTGEPRYTVISKDGTERPSTLRDAKKAAAAGTPWVPSTTTVMRCAYKWQLEDWKQRQSVMAALTTERQPGETDEAFVERILADSREQAKKAAERGTEIHAAVEAHFAGRPYNPADEPWAMSIARLLQQEFGVQAWRPEKSFASPLGYGGKVDLHSDAVLVDFKGKSGDRAKWQVYDEHAMQLAAYAKGVYACVSSDTGLRCGIIFFDRDEPYSEFHEVKPPALERGWRQFEALLNYWKATNL